MLKLNLSNNNKFLSFLKNKKGVICKENIIYLQRDIFSNNYIAELLSVYLIEIITDKYINTFNEKLNKELKNIAPYINNIDKIKKVLKFEILQFLDDSNSFKESSFFNFNIYYIVGNLKKEIDDTMAEISSLNEEREKIPKSLLNIPIILDDIGIKLIIRSAITGEIIDLENFGVFYSLVVNDLDLDLELKYIVKTIYILLPSKIIFADNGFENCKGNKEKINNVQEHHLFKLTEKLQNLQGKK